MFVANKNRFSEQPSAGVFIEPACAAAKLGHEMSKLGYPASDDHAGTLFATLRPSCWRTAAAVPAELIPAGSCHPSVDRAALSGCITVSQNRGANLV